MKNFFVIVTKNSFVMSSDSQGHQKYTTRNSCSDKRRRTNLALKLPWLFLPADGEASFATSKFSLLPIRWHSATRKHLFPYPQGDRSGLRKPKMDKATCIWKIVQRRSIASKLNAGCGGHLDQIYKILVDILDLKAGFPLTSFFIRNDCFRSTTINSRIGSYFFTSKKLLTRKNSAKKCFVWKHS